MGNGASVADPNANVLKHISVINGKYQVPVVAFTPPKFEPSDPAALQYLEENGYVVFSAVSSSEETTKAIDLFWTHIETETQGKISRNDPKTWTDANNFPGGFTGVGIMTTLGIGHAAWLWYLRGLPRVVKSFETIWETDDLLTSFDGGGVFRPPEIDDSWVTRDGWFHVDQNWRYKPNRVSVQGLVNLFPSGPQDGGLVVIPKSHRVFEALAKDPESGPMRRQDYVKMTDRDIPELWANGAYKLCLEPGDLAMWDSRTTHCNHPATKTLTKIMNNNKESIQLRRLVGYICLTPTKFAEDKERLIKRRVQAYQEAQTSTHWPHEFHPSAMPYKSFKPPELNERQRQLLVGNESTIDIKQPITAINDDS